MTNTIIKFLISAALIVGISEISKRSTLLGGFLGSLPIVSLLAIIWLYRDTGDATRVATLSTNIFWLVLPSLMLFLALPFLIKHHVSFYTALSLSVVLMLLTYGITLLILKQAGVKL